MILPMGKRRFAVGSIITKKKNTPKEKRGFFSRRNHAAASNPSTTTRLIQHSMFSHSGVPDSP